MRLHSLAIVHFSLIIVGLLASSNITFAQELPATPAARKLAEFLACLNNDDAEARQPFIENEFSDEGDLQASVEQRAEISSRMHDQFAPFEVIEVVEDEELSISAKCKTSKEVQMLIELTVSAEDHHKITAIGMSTIDSDDAESVPAGMVRLFGEDGKSVEAARGVWEAKGYGYVFEVKEDSFVLYNVTKSFGWEQEFEEDLFFKEGEDPGTALVTMHEQEPGYNLTRMGKLPPQCKPKSEWKQTEVFGAFLELFSEHYPFFKERNVDWESRARKIRPTITDSSSDAELFAAMEMMLKDLGDGHVSLDTEIDGESKRIRSSKMNTLNRLRASFVPDEKFKSWRTFFRDWNRRFEKSILEQTLRGKGVETANGQIMWGRPHDRIGYIAVFGMGGYSYGNIDSQLETLNRLLDEILKELADTDALIVDISFNGGGFDFFGTEIAARFTDEKRLAFSKWPATETQYRQDRYITPRTEKGSSAVMYSKPVWLVTNDVTASAAEIFTMCMRSIPSVTTVGLPTEGALSDILQKTLPNGWEMGLSNEIYHDHEGVCHEGPGVPPQIKMDIFDRDELEKVGHAESMQKIVKMMLDELDGK